MQEYGASIALYPDLWRVKTCTCVARVLPLVMCTSLRERKLHLAEHAYLVSWLDWMDTRWELQSYLSVGPAFSQRQLLVWNYGHSSVETMWLAEKDRTDLFMLYDYVSMSADIAIVVRWKITVSFGANNANSHHPTVPKKLKPQTTRKRGNHFAFSTLLWLVECTVFLHSICGFHSWKLSWLLAETWGKRQTRGHRRVGDCFQLEWSVMLRWMCLVAFKGLMQRVLNCLVGHVSLASVLQKILQVGELHVLWRIYNAIHSTLYASWLYSLCP